MTGWQIEAIAAWTLIAEEQARPRFHHRTPRLSVCLTVRAGWG